ncbi:MAG: PD-(D/E)XK nuclease family protein [Candidatus Promineifilaceae bacterium]
MTNRILLSPAASGKTGYILQKAKSKAKQLDAEPRILIPATAHRYALRRRLAEAGGALGVRTVTFSEIYTDCLSSSAENYILLSDTIRYQLVRFVVSQQKLDHYQPLINRSGFVKELVRIFDDLKAARIWPDKFLQAVEALGDPPRLHELGSIYEAYQDYLHKLKWADDPGRGWLAVEAMENEAIDIASDWRLLAVDGFDNFTEVQLAMLQILSTRVEETIVTLTIPTEEAEAGVDRPTFQRFQETRRSLEEALGVTAEPLQNRSSWVNPWTISRSYLFDHLEKHLFADAPAQLNAGEAVTLIAAPDRAAEVRAAFRWLKERIVHNGLRPGDVALLARDITPYRSFIVQTAAEFGIPIHLSRGSPLRSNPAIVAILDLLSLSLPLSESDPSPALPRYGVINAWRTPYFYWASTILPQNELSGAITPEDAEMLDAQARAGRVIGGLEQWNELVRSIEASAPGKFEGEDEKKDANRNQDLVTKFRAFQKLIEPPLGKRTYHDFVQWLDGLLGPAPEVPPKDRDRAENLFLNVWDPAKNQDDPVAIADVHALYALKEILRSMVWVEEALGHHQKADYSQFVLELTGMVDTAFYSPPQDPGSEKVFVADVIDARGLPFRAVAVMGMAEGGFPATYVEDPFLWESDRNQLRSNHKLPLNSSIESFEREYFYQTITRPNESLLLTRPRLADSGAEWQASPFWEEIRRLVHIQPDSLTSESAPTPDQAASLPELVESLIAHPHVPPAMTYLEDIEPGRWSIMVQTSHIFELRFSGTRTQFNGDLTSQAMSFAQKFDANHHWSPSRLESYHSCPYSFYVGRVLKLERREEPAEGLDVAQLGTIYHQILQRLYQALESSERTDPEKLLALLPAIAGRVLDDAPRTQGFRETAWWYQTREAITRNVERSIRAMAELQGEFVPVHFELRFSRANPLTVRDGNDQFLLNGVIDRLDRDPQGRFRIIDYKTAGPYKYTKQSLEKGDKIQLSLYALAARDALDLGEPVDGFYWHVKHAKPSPLTLRSYGPSQAIDKALFHAWASVHGARGGYFVPRPPPDGCPDYCPAAAFCWSFHPGIWR